MISLFTSPNTTLKTLSAQLFFIISKQKTERFINLTGFGNGAGLLYDSVTVLIFTVRFQMLVTFFRCLLDEMDHFSRIAEFQMAISQPTEHLRTLFSVRGKTLEISFTLPKIKYLGVV